MARRVLAWECRYCGTIKKTENICVRHEKTCMKNPDARNCILCQHSITNSGTRDLVCKKGKKCSQATSANCEYFGRKDGKV
jgi:hypothetical protein